MTAPTFQAELPASALAAALARVARIVPTRNTIPIIGHTLMRFAGERLTLAGTDFDQTLTVAVDAKGKGATTADAHKLAAIAQALKAGEPVKLSLGETGILTVTQGRTRHRLPTLPAEDFPEVLTTPPDGAVEWKAKAERLVAVFKALEQAVYDGAAAPPLTGLCLDFAASAEHPRIAATDKRMLGAIRVDDLAPPGHERIIMPADAVRVVAEIARGADTIEVHLAANLLTFRAGDTSYMTKLIDGAFPDYDRIIPAEPKTFVTVEADAFRAGIAHTRLIRMAGADGKAMPTLVKIEIRDGEMIFSARNGAGEEAETACPCEIEGDPVTIGAQGRCLSWAADSLDPADTLELRITDPMSPFAIIRKGDDEARDLRVIAPVALK